MHSAVALVHVQEGKQQSARIQEAVRLHDIVKHGYQRTPGVNTYNALLYMATACALANATAFHHLAWLSTEPSLKHRAICYTAAARVQGATFASCGTSRRVCA